MFKKLNIFLGLCIFIILFFTNCNTKNMQTIDSSILQVHYIDVNQGDSILIQINNKNMLIDSGPKEYRSNLISYIKKLNLSKIDYLIATHPHEDHIGNMSTIIKKFNIGSFYAPKVESTSKCFEDMISALKAKNLKINILNNNTNSINIGNKTQVNIYTYDINNLTNTKNLNYNNYSPLIHLIYGNTSFLFTGDLEKDGEESILSNSPNLKSMVLKIGHHGSSSSTSEIFLKAVTPSVAVISVGKDNSYGHPHKETLDTLNKYNIKTLRTDIEGTITLCSDGNKIYKK